MSLSDVSTDQWIGLALIASVYLIFRILFIKIVSNVYYYKNLSTKKRLSFFQSDLPPVFPNGWIPVAYSSLLNSDKIYESALCGNEIILFRDEDSKVTCLDAYCPHLGAHLAYGGSLFKQKNETCIKCPFHGWSFNKRGDCVDIPYNCSKEIPRGTSIKSYHVIELNDFVYVWYHADGEEPSWYPDKIDQVESKEWKFLGRTEHIVSCHFQEIPENGADVSHLNALHQDSVINGSDLASNQKWFSNLINKMNYHEWHAEYDVTENEMKRKFDKLIKSNVELKLVNRFDDKSNERSHITRIFLNKKTIFFNLNVFEMNLDIAQIGPSIVYLKFKSHLFGFHVIDAVFVQSIQPLEPFTHKITHHFFSKDGFFYRCISKLFLYGEATMIERDILIWTHKKFLKKAYLLKSEKSIAKFRKWFQQFYSPSSLTVEMLKNRLDW